MSETEERIVRTKIQLQKRQPFFAYLLTQLRFVKRESMKTMGVDSNGTVYYSEGFVKEMSDDELEGVLCHEVLHLALQHLIRRGKRDFEIFNVACDLCVNDILIANGFNLPIYNALVPENHKFNFKGILIKDIDKKSAEEVYSELYDKLPKIEIGIISKNDGKDKRIPDELKGFDVHITAKGMSKEESERIKKEAEKWKKLLVEAYTFAKMRGTEPLGIERYIEELHKSKLDWKAILWKFVSNEIPYDFTYMKPSKKAEAVGIYMPSVVRENVDIIVAVDTSGSISNKDLADFLSEIIAIAKSFNQVRMTLITHDATIQDVYRVENGNIDKIRNLKIHGGGGTSHKDVFEKVEKEYANAKLLILFTDGYSDLEEVESNKRTLIVLAGDYNKKLKEKELKFPCEIIEVG